MRNKSNKLPDFTWDEWILVLELHMKNRDKTLKKSSPELIEVSDELRKLGDVLGNEVSENYRNPAGIRWQYERLRRGMDPQIELEKQGEPTKKSKLVWQTFANDPDKLKKAAQIVRVGIYQDSNRDDFGLSNPNMFIKPSEEGFFVTKLHTIKEQNEVLLADKLESLQNEGEAGCSLCEFKIKQSDLAKPFYNFDYHLKMHPDDIVQNAKPKLDDAVLLCVSCHRHVHSTTPWATV